MKTIEKTCTIYQAFDGMEFTNYEECEKYEIEKAKEVKVNLRNFDIEFPMQDQFTYCHVYLVHSENEFEMLKAYILNEYSETDDGYLEYDGNGWYVVQGGDSGYADLYKLNDIVKEWNGALEVILENTSKYL